MRLFITIVFILFAGFRAYAQQHGYIAEKDRQYISEDNVFALIAIEEKIACTDENDFNLDPGVSFKENEEVILCFPESETVNRYHNTGHYTSSHLLPWFTDLPPPSAC